MLWGWAMLVVVLLSAAPTSAQPRSRLVGSAFDPAAVSVVVNPRKPRPDEGIVTPSDDDPTGVAFGDPPDAVVARRSWLPAEIARSRVPARSPDDIALRRSPLRANAARAPPPA